MSYLEEAIIGRYSGLRILIFGIAVAVIGVLPLLLYIEVGLEDGNPIGLGLLAMVALPAGAVIAAIGLIKLVVQYFMRRVS